MNPETLDRLLTDRALGELSPEVAELLDAHLAADAGAARRAAACDADLRLIRKAGELPANRTAAPLRAIDLARLRRKRRLALLAPRPAAALRLAAGLAIGLAGGWLAHSPDLVRSGSAAVATVPRANGRTNPAANPAANPGADPNASARFWTVAYLARASNLEHLQSK